jgi:predicted TIM-barrel fold metal-dependent hydrolase
MRKLVLVVLVLTLVCLLVAQQQQAPAPPAPTIEEYEPKAMLVTSKTETPRAKYPFIDIHTHQRDTTKLDSMLKDMDQINMKIMLSSPVRGSFGERTKKFIDGIRAHPQSARFASMTNIDYAGIGSPDYGQRAAALLEQDIKNGAIGVKVHKNLGHEAKDVNGNRVPVDDDRLKPVWDIAAKYKTPVMIHTGDPKPLYDAMDKYNERWLELRLRPGRGEPGQAGMKWEQVMSEQHSLFAKNPKTIFIAAHMGWLAHDLGKLGEMLDRMPNLNVEIAAILGELGRQPRTARKFFIKYQDRILFGKDTYNVSEYPFYFRILESDDDWIDNIRKYHGLWKLYGLDLPDDVLKKVYYKNALRLFPQLSSAGFPR